MGRRSSGGGQYDEKEHIIGQYKEKPLYRRLVKFTTPSKANTMTVVATVADAGTFDDIPACRAYWTEHPDFGAEIGYHAPKSMITSAVYLARTGQLWCWMADSTQWLNKPAYCVLEYTKKSDSP